MTKSLLTLGLLTAMLGSATSRALAQDALVAETIVYSANAGVINVTAAPYNADNTGVADATAAIQAAIDFAKGNNKGKIVYLPNGTYRITNKLIFSTDAALHRSMIVQGQSRTGTILKLDDNIAPATVNLPVLKCVEGPTFHNSMFSTNICNLTIDTGVGNPGAVGINYLASNIGTIRNVLIKSSDPLKVGRAGIELTTAIPGPAIIKNVTIEGFDNGIRTRQVQYSLTFENITLRQQRVTGILNDAQTLCIRHLLSENTVPAIRQTTGGESKGIITLIDSELRGGDVTNHAIDLADGFLFARNIMTAGYASALRVAGAALLGNSIVEYVSGPVSSLLSPQPRSLNLPVQETPEVPLEPLSAWVSVAAYNALPGDNIDDTAAIQAALNSGASTIYFPNPNNSDVGSRYLVSGTLTVGGNVQRLVGLYSQIVTTITNNFKDSSLPIFRFVGGTQPVIVMEGFRTGTSGGKPHLIEQASAKTLVLRNISIRNGYGYRNTGFGDVFLEDFHSLPVGINYDRADQQPGLIFRNQRVWARQLNPEQNGVNIVNDGGTLWILGLKTEYPNTLVETKNGGKTEVLGGLTVTLQPPTAPAFINDNSSVSIAGFGEVRPNMARSVYTNVVTETRGTTTATLTASQLPTRKAQQDMSLSFVLPLYTGYATPTAVAPTTPDATSFALYPNPTLAGTSVTLRLPTALAADGQRLRVYSTTGQVQAEAAITAVQTVMSIADWTPGLYHFIVLDKQGRWLTAQHLVVAGH